MAQVTGCYWEIGALNYVNFKGIECYIRKKNPDFEATLNFNFRCGKNNVLSTNMQPSIYPHKCIPSGILSAKHKAKKIVPPAQPGGRSINRDLLIKILFSSPALFA
jgi:hypothetical protein